MVTYARRIDALGGTCAEKSEDWNEGYNTALTDAEDIGGEADDVIAELVETLNEIVTGTTGDLHRWAEQAGMLVRRVQARTAK